MVDKNRKSGDSSWVLSVAQLARIELDESEKEKFSGQLGAVLSNFEILSKADTSGIEETAQVSGLSNVFRADEINNPSGAEIREELLSNVPNVENGAIKVPEVFGNK